MAKTQPTRVLLVEDEALLADLMSGTLVDSGYVVHVVADAAAALERIRAGEPFDVLFTDVILPGKMGGAELATRTRELRPDLPIVYASGIVSAGEIDAPVSRSVFVQKPYDPRDLCALIGRLAPAI